MAISRRMLLGRLGAGAALIAASPRLVRTSHSTPIRLNRNENAYGASPSVAEAIRHAESRAASRYPDVEADTLRRRIAAFHRVAPEQVVLGCGSEEILRAAISAFAGRENTLVTSKPTFELIAGCGQRAGAEVIGVPLGKDWAHDVEGMLARCGAATGLAYICNPNNPTGTLTPRGEIERFIRRRPPSTVVLIDEAYHEYVGEAADHASFIDRPSSDAGVMVTRSFSKIHGLAGLRVGYAITSATLARTLTAHMLSDGVNVMASRAAVAALDDRDHARASADRNVDDRQEFLNQANARMLRSVDSVTNFVMLNTARPAAAVVKQLADHGILVSGPVPGFEMYIRVSIGSPDAMREFWRVWDLTMPHKMML